MQLYLVKLCITITFNLEMKANDPVPSPTSNPLTFGKEIEMIRQRFFIEYRSSSETQHSEEYTFMCKTINPKGIDNIFIKSPKLLPNLKIYDSDGSELALVTNKLTKALIKNLSKKSSGTIKNELDDLLKQMSDKKIFLLWIKLPSNRRFFQNETRIIKLEYDATQSETHRKRVLEFHSAPHETFYTIKSPSDYRFFGEKMVIYNPDGTTKEQKNGWKNKKGDPYYFNKGPNYVSIRISPNTPEKIVFNYSFLPTTKLVVFPLFTLALLFTASILLLLLQSHTACTRLNLCTIAPPIVAKHLELGIGIIGAALVVPGLIQNQDVRNDLNFFYIGPIILSVIGIFL